MRDVGEIPRICGAADDLLFEGLLRVRVLVD